MVHMNDMNPKNNTRVVGEQLLPERVDVGSLRRTITGLAPNHLELRSTEYQLTFLTYNYYCKNVMKDLAL
jgi:hypothetical protein